MQGEGSWAWPVIALVSDHDRMIVPTLQRGNAAPDAPASPNRQHPLPGGVLFFACPKKRTKRKGSPAAETTPVDGLRNRRGKNSLRSNSLPLSPGSAPRRPAQRQRAVFVPGDPSCPEPPSRRGQPSTSRRSILREIVPTRDRSHAPAWERRPGRSSVRFRHQPPTPTPPSRAWPAPTAHDCAHR